MIGCFNYYGLIIITVIMIPNIAFALTSKENNHQTNKIVVIFEQIGRYGCFALMIFNIPFTHYGFYFKSAEMVYLITNGILVFVYLMFWIICWKKYYKFRSYALSILPTVIFLFSSIILGYYLLMAFSLVFGICHIYISIKSSE